MNDRALTVVLGIGNLAMRDEGIGIHLLRSVQGRMPAATGIEFLEVGTSMMGAVHALANRQKAVLLDCALMGGVPGSIRRFAPDEARTVKHRPGYSLHEGDVLHSIELSARMGECPPHVVIFGIEPVCIEPGEGLSPVLERHLSSYVEEVLKELISPRGA